jgi:hypothetical protein
MPSAGWSDRLTVSAGLWRPAPPTGDRPVTGPWTLYDALCARIPWWDTALIVAGLLGVLGALLVGCVEAGR